MSHIIENFGFWKKVNEQDLPGRERQFGSKDNKIVAIPIDKNTLKLKIVNDADLISDRRLTPDGFDALLTWIKGQSEIISYYTTLNDLANNIVVYTVTSDNDRKQIVIFKIWNKSALKVQDPSKPGINPKVRFIREDELSKALDGTILNTKELANVRSTPAQQSAQQAGFNFPFPIKSIPNSTNPKLISFITLAYNKLNKDAQISSSVLLPKVKAEVKSGKLGPDTVIFIKALNAGYSIADDQFPEDTETDITQALYDKLNSEQEAINADLFLAIANTIVPNTGEFKVPAGGFKYGAENDAELAKFQKLLVTKFAKHLKNHPVYQKFKNAGARGFKGNYGPLTKDLVYLLKAIAENPVYPNRDGSTIEPEFVNLVLKVQESESFAYLSIDGTTLIFEQFNYSAATTVSPAASQQPRGTENTVPAEKSSGKYLLQGKDEYEYTVKDGAWYWKKGSTSQILTNAASIKELQRLYPNAGGFYIKIGIAQGKKARVNKHLYKITDGTWYVKLNGSNSWQKVTLDADLQVLKDTYGAMEKQKESKITSTSEIDSLHKKIAKTIKGWFPKDSEKSVFRDFRHTAFNFQGGDDESGAWEEFKRLWNTGENSIKVKLAKAQAGIDRLPDAASKERCQKNQKLLAGIIKEGGTFYKKFQGGTTDDNFTIALYQADGTPYKITIDTDI